LTIQASGIELYDSKSGNQTNGVGKIYFTIQAKVPIPIEVLAYNLDTIKASIAMILEVYNYHSHISSTPKLPRKALVANSFFSIQFYCTYRCPIIVYI
jgi:hypothetical protein